MKITWQEAEEKAKHYNSFSKISIFFFVDPICEICNQFIPDIISPLTKKYEDFFDLYIIDDTYGMLFPPTEYPTGYIYIPNCPNNMPLRRVGDAPKDFVEKDMIRQIKSMNTGKDLEELRNEV